ncbi:hypothetical protein TEA_020435 [Camellia sinensis var. sinensis]|uniref:Iron-sulfur protein NUBPL n=1 Tax=Camellia sinensis var. sinensis TaxID=542762 RepID=A0A4V3WIQ4_CAMSN|nr:hypothetical protein TEA_020435 [Camellia sinensis var. sinensis]
MKASLRSFLVSELEFSIKASSNFKSQLVSSSIRLRLTFVLKKLGGARGFAAANAQGLKIKGVEDIIAVASGKGGVGKSTTAGFRVLCCIIVALMMPFEEDELVTWGFNLAVALANKCRLKVGLLDADVYGPSIPTMMKLHGKPEVSEDKKMIPIENHGVKCMSMGFLLAEKYAPIVWRGPMILGLLENMSFFKCPHCGEPSHIFGKGGARKTADEMGLQFLGEIPLEVEIRSCSDEGVPVVISNPDSTVSKAYGDVALKVVSRLEELSKQQQLRPEINL